MILFFRRVPSLILVIQNLLLYLFQGLICTQGFTCSSRIDIFHILLYDEIEAHSFADVSVTVIIFEKSTQ